VGVSPQAVSSAASARNAARRSGVLMLASCMA
jgi:hypothetical protein